MSIRSELLPNGLLTIVIYALVLSLPFSQLTFAEDVCKLGVLSTKGAKVSREDWQPTADYLSNKTGRKFALSPLRLRHIGPAVRNGRADFILSKPGTFCRLMEKYGVVL